MMSPDLSARRSFFFLLYTKAPESREGSSVLQGLGDAMSFLSSPLKLEQLRFPQIDRGDP